MPEKSSRKQRRLIQADLNFIAEHNLEMIAARLQNPVHKRITGLVNHVDEDTANFVLYYQRNGRETALVKGILQRWAGDMTHIYCEGRAFRRQQYGYEFVRLLYRSMMVLPLLLVGEFLLLVFFGAWLPAGFLGWMMVLTVALLVLTGLIIGGRELLRFMVSAPDDDPLFEFSPQPEAKDRERLLDYLADVIHDGAIHPVDRLAAQSAVNGEQRIPVSAFQSTSDSGLPGIPSEFSKNAEGENL